MCVTACGIMHPRCCRPVARAREKRNTQGLGEKIYRKDDTKVGLNELE